VPGGPLTSQLQKIVPGDTVLMRQKSTGTLVLDALTPARRLFMVAPAPELRLSPVSFATPTHSRSSSMSCSPTPAATIPS
jgi:hypothetical protein